MSTTDLPHGAARLGDWGVIRARGSDAATLLHSVLTQDIAQLQRDEARLAGLCSPKGRLLASFVIWRAGDEEYLLACSADLLAPTLKRLSMFVLRAKCRLTDASGEYSIFGLAGESAGSVLTGTVPATPWSICPRGDGWVIRLPEGAGQPRWLLVQPAAATTPALPVLDPAAWAWLEVHSAVARICAATVDQFVPQMVNFELAGGVNFRKGCYPGQEVVARSQYRGTVKRRAMLFDCDATLTPGQEVYHSQDPDQPAGMVANAAPRPGGGSTALVEVKLAALDGGSLHASSASGPLLTRLELPYVLPVDAD